MGATTIAGAEVRDVASRGSAATSGGFGADTTISGGSAASAATSGNPSVDVAGSGTLAVVNTAHTHQKAIPHMGNATDKGITSGTKGFESAGLEIPAARADTSGGSSTLDASLRY